MPGPCLSVLTSKHKSCCPTWSIARASSYGWRSPPTRSGTCRTTSPRIARSWCCPSSTGVMRIWSSPAAPCWWSPGISPSSLALPGSWACLPRLVCATRFVIRRRLRVAAKRIQEARDVRGRLCNEFLSAMRVVKCFSLEPMALEMLGGARDRELEAQWFKRKVFPFQNFLGSSVSLFGTIISFLWLELVLDKPVDAAIAFTVLSWSALLKDSLMAVPNQIATLLDCYVSVQRIQQLLTCQARELTRERLGV
ncbi:unnamed protein product [Durusdinium trenchii]|uniref:ABC transmembrane type-1 domain-containing protein n=1 Tax=Durusdinium trenchii TaxID=1381693 RepID=A0ABP0QG45_9DINO